MNDQTKTFEARCYELLKLIPKGKVTTYGEIARALNTKAYQAVGNAMAKNKNLFVIPCHRVIRTHIPQLRAEKKIVHLYYFFLRRFIIDFNNFIKNPV